MTERADTLSPRTRAALRREALRASATEAAINFAWECGGDVAKLREEIADTDDLLSNPSRARPDLAPGTTPRTYQEAYLAGLRRALELILAGGSPDHD
jgi:hypothetical protein